MAGARSCAERSGSRTVQLPHLVLALLEEDEGRPAVLLERAGLSVPEIRTRLTELGGSFASPADTALFNAARNWSLTYRHDPEFLTDAFLVAVLRADATFTWAVAEFGLDVGRLESLLIGTTEQPGPATEPEHTLAVFSPSDPSGEADAARVLDANFNRAREAARVLEDYCRFILDDRFLTEQVKELRHGLATASGRLPPALLLTARDTLGDVGTSVSVDGEYDRANPARVAVVNLKRLQESLRSLEEFGKLFGPELGRELEAIRYRAYTLERAVHTAGHSRDRLRRAHLYLLLTGAQCRAALDWTIEQAVAGGVDVVQLREKAMPDRELIARARAVRRWTRDAGVLFIVNDRPDIARLVEADGVHLGQDDLTVKDARRILGPNTLIGVSTHTIEQVRRAVLDGADYLGIGPVFPSRTKTFEHFPGLEFVRAATAETSLPTFALGGIGPGNLAAVVEAGAKRVAVASAMAEADDPGQMARSLKAGLGSSRSDLRSPETRNPSD